MPFHEGVYTPYRGDTQGTHSSAGIPSLLNSPLSQHTVNGLSAPAADMTPSIGSTSIPPFKFRPRRETVDWRRINAVDVDRVVSQLDVDTLQEHINTVTFCSLDGERCQRCQSPVDPVLIKLLRLAQLTVEWVLHCQEVLTLNLHAAEEKLAASGRERKELLDQQSKQEEKVKSMAAELKQRKKMIRSQQSLLVPHIISSKKCAHCDKTFLNTTFLQSHMQRRHPEEYESKLRSDNENKSVIEDLRMEISSQKEQIVQLQLSLQAKTAQSHMQRRHPEDYDSDSEKKPVIENLKMEIISQKEQIVQLQQSLQAKTTVEKELQNMHKELMRELDHFKAEEMTRNIQALNEANQNLTAKNSQPERDLDIYKEMQTHAIQKLEHQLVKQEKKMESRLQDIQAQHESEKNQLLKDLGRMQSSVSRLQQERSHWQQREMERRLQEKEQTIQAQRKQMRNVTSKPPKVTEVPVSASVPEPKPKKVVLDSSSISERRPVEKKPELVRERKRSVSSSSSLKKDPRMKKEILQVLDQTLVKRLETLGVKSDQGGLKLKKFTSCLAKVQSEQDKAAKKMPDYWHHREELANTLEEKMGGQKRGSSPASKSQAAFRQSDKVLQIRPRSSSLPSRSAHVTSGAAVTQSKTPQPAPRSKSSAQPKTSTPNTKTVARTFKDKTPPFSSEEESDDEDLPQKHHSAKTSQSTLNQSNSIQVKGGRTSPVHARHSFSSNSQQPRGSAGAVTKTAVTKMDSDDDDETEWSEVSELQEIDPRQLQSYNDHNGNVDKRSFGKENKINILARKIGQQFAQRSIKKPAGGVSILAERKDKMQELEDTDLEESSDWLVSSLEDRQEVSKAAKGSGPLKKSVESPSTSVWGTSTGNAPKSGVTEAGTGSTLKSTLCSLSDFSDSEDISN